MDLQLWTISKLNKLTLSLRRDLHFYAPLQDHLDFYGIEPVTFTRVGQTSATWRDGVLHSIPDNTPRFNYSNGQPLGMYIQAGEALQFSAANGLDSANTLIWFENEVPKSTPANTNPFSSSGLWTGNLNTHIKHITKANRVLANSEIMEIQSVLSDISQAISAPAPPLPPPITTPGSFFMEVPSGARNSNNVTFTLSNNVVLDSLILVCFGTVLERVAANPGYMEFTAGGAGNRTLTLGLGPTTGYPFFAQYLVSA